MKITRITVYQLELPLTEGRYAWSEGKPISAPGSTRVRLETDAGLAGGHRLGQA